MSNSNSDLSNKAGDAGDHLEMLSQDLGKRFGSKVSQLTDATKDYAENGRQFVQENPMKGILLSALAGVALGSILTLTLSRR